MTRAILLPAGNPSPWTGPTGNNTYLLPGRVPALVDAGVGATSHLEALARELGGSSLELALITHGHVDHVGGAPALTARWPNLQIRQLGAGTAPISAGDRIAAGDGLLRAIPTPGHSPDHCCFFDEEAGDLFCGDLVRVGGTVVIPASRGGNLQAYLQSLRRVRDLGARRLLPGHGPAIDEPVELIEMYLRHRAEREDQVLEALHSGCRTPEEIVGVVYRGLAPSLLGAAADSVLAHLIKLEQEGRVARRVDRWVQAG